MDAVFRERKQADLKISKPHTQKVLVCNSVVTPPTLPPPQLYQPPYFTKIVPPILLQS